MNRLFAIVLTLFALLPHPALMAGMWSSDIQECPVVEQCSSGCVCCPAGHCDCAGDADLPAPPQTPAPVRSGDFYPVPALPPGESAGIPEGIPAEIRTQLIPSATDRAPTQDLVPLHVRHCVFRI